MSGTPLQERKRVLAKELITDDDGFVKTLTKEDVEYLFSWYGVWKSLV